ncbi:MAG: 3-dehydroquinate dehydratase II (EC 4.2.1.10) [Olavius algarvensis Delta 4 endosymbiont]|nr:MAG: 3-dehydroquinate dehydratase II (EC 4.2.1.10) [Olavius algarvensis Delta 4 endosymbiont]
MPKILVIHGPNLNMLGKREPEVYGSEGLEEINTHLTERAQALNVDLDLFQSNHEGQIVDKIQAAVSQSNAVIINPAAFTHTSVAIRDALLLLEVPIIEVHLSNIFKREPFRHKSLMTDVATGQICGLGAHGYLLALEAVAKLI